MAEEPRAERVPKTSRKGLLIGVGLAAVFGAGAFYAVFSGLILALSDVEEGAVVTGGDAAMDGGEHDTLSGLTVPASVSDVAFLPVEPIVVSLAGPEKNRHLRFRAELEVPTPYRGDVEHLMPRVIDVMNAYLRAVDPQTLSSPGALILLRSQILRRIGLVVGTERVNDVLVMEFVLS